MKRVVSLLMCVLLCLPLCALAQDSRMEASAAPHRISFSFSLPGQEYAYVTFGSRNDSGEMVLHSANGSFAGECYLPGTDEAVRVTITAHTLSGREIIRSYVTSAAATGEKAPAAELPEARSAGKIKDGQVWAAQDGIHYRFSVPGRDRVVVRCKSPQEAHNVTVFAGPDYVYEGVMKMPYTYADDIVTFTVYTVTSNELYQQTLQAWFEPPRLAAQAPEGRLKGVTVCVDPGHQRQTQVETVPLGPGFSTNTTTKVGMAQGKVTFRRESMVVLEVGLQLRNALLAEGAQVIMTRETQDTFVGMLDRAAIPNDAGADFVLRLHCNSRGNEAVQGIQIYCPLSSEYAKKVASEDAYRQMGMTLLEAMQAATGVRKGSCTLNNNYVGNNWSKMPSFLVEMGYMTNREEDLKLSYPLYQQQLVQGMVEGVVLLARQRGLTD